MSKKIDANLRNPFEEMFIQLQTGKKGFTRKEKYSR